MGSLFDALIAGSASPMLDQHFGEAVRITRGTNTTVGVIASWSAQSEETLTTDAKHTAIVDRFWFVAVAKYTIAGVAVEPRTGDRITDGAGRIWEILPARAVPPVVSYGGSTWKVATKQVT